MSSSPCQAVSKDPCDASLTGCLLSGVGRILVGEPVAMGTFSEARLTIILETLCC